ncbi:MAG: DsbA family oxidoreductase [Cyclobacteriaceae bacterium]|nr:DsbA family oxidoreductase [Cyclobacteriaceae bacterium]
MKVEIWSDVMCPFCYIGKRRFEAAVNSLGPDHPIEVEWKSFQLDPGLVAEPGKSINQYLAERKGWTTEYARQMNAHVTGMAAAEGLHYDFDKAVVANSHDAHRLSHLAKQHGLQDALEERLFAAYFTEGKDTGDPTVLKTLALEIGLPAHEVDDVLTGSQFSEAVRHDIAEASQLGIRGVPFFVINRKYGISGAQSHDVFLRTLKAAAADESSIQANAGASCDVDGNCN